MTDAPNHETFDLIEALQGINYPEDSVEVFLDDNLMYLRNKAEKELRKAEILNQKDQVEEISKRLEELLDAASVVKFTFHVRAISRRDHQSLSKEVLKQYPVEKDFLGREESNPDREDLYAEKTWAAHIVKIVNPAGAVQNGITPEEARAFIAQAPRSATEAVQAKIEALYEGSKEGYESLIKETNFLSDASPEA